MGDEIKEKLTPPPHSISRREFLKGVGVGAGATVLAGLPVLGHVLNERENAKRELLMSQLGEARTREELRQALTQETKSYLEEYDYRLASGNSVLRDSTDPNYQQRRQPERESARFLMERGVTLLSTWGVLNNESGSSFDAEGRLSIEGKKFAVNQDVSDFHLAFNLIKAKLSLNVETDVSNRALVEEDYRDLLEFVDLGQEIEISPDSWIIMPKEWATSLARFTLIIKKGKIPLPEKIVIDPKVSTEMGLGGYYEGVSGRFPERGQVLNLSSRDGASVIFHEGGHYIADSHAAKRRAIGLPQEQEIPNHALDFEAATAKAQKEQLLEARSREERRVEELDQFISDYSVTNPGEDFAEIFREFLAGGPLFRVTLEERRARSKAGASILQAKYDYMKEKVTGGEEFSFEARKVRNAISGWEDGLLKDFQPAPSLRKIAEAAAKNAQKIMNSFPGLEEVEVISVIPEGDYDYALSLLEPAVWRDIMQLIPNEKISSTSALYPVSHLELKGKFTFRAITPQRERSIILDTADSSSIEKFVDIASQINAPSVDITPRQIEISQEAQDGLGKLGLSFPRVYPWGWGHSYPPSFIDTPNLAYVHFQENSETGKWETVPIDVRQISVHITSPDEFGRESMIGGVATPIKLGKKDVILAIRLNGEIDQLRLNGLKS